MKIAVYPGSFDPVSNGHLDIIERVAKVFDKVYVVVAINQQKHYTFTTDEKVLMLQKVTKHIPNVIIDKSSDLVSLYSQKVKANVIIRGLRNFNDYQDEISLFQFNRSISPDIDTFALFPSANNLFLSSSTIKELVLFNASIEQYVPKEIVQYVTDIIKERHSINK